VEFLPAALLTELFLSSFCRYLKRNPGSSWHFTIPSESFQSLNKILETSLFSACM
jgi:hypothetical protein